MSLINDNKTNLFSYCVVLGLIGALSPRRVEILQQNAGTGLYMYINKVFDLQIDFHIAKINVLVTIF